ncbi:MAG: FAD-dependent oxidoreductase [Crocinitomicaceae bacterium]|nr:FAD-dependent oxidoreductase [Crocinitomicaceae bacterium]
MKIAIIGAGPAGMTAAYQLSKEIKDIDLYEATSSVGGMAKSIDLWNQKVDIGPHRFFSNDTRINELWLEVADKDFEMVDRLTRIYYNKRFFHYPIKAFDALKNLGIPKATACIISYGAEKISPTKDTSTFEGWVRNRFGKKLYSIFFKTYTEKLWGIPCNTLDADFAAQRIKKFSLGEAIKTAVFGNSGKHKTLVDQFAYPHGGTGMIYERMAEFVRMKGGNILLNTPIKRVLTKDNKAYAIELEDGTIKEYDHIISSMPLSLMVTRLPEVPENIKLAASKLNFRNTIIVYLNVQAKDLFPDNWLYVHSADLRMGRLTNFRNWVPQINGQEQSTICALEYWCYDDDDFWKWDSDKLIELGKEELRKTGLIKDAEISDGFVYKIHRCYPVYSKGYKEILTPVEDYLKSIENLHVIGRYGAFKYNNQDHSILMGMLVAENILQNKNHNLWNINTDYDDYQESSVITKTGLVKE